MRLPQTGGCLCGAVRYEITAPPLVTYACHCTICQKLTGSAFSLAIVVPAEACRFAGGETRSFERLADSGRTVCRWVCVRCGTWLCNGTKPGTASPGRVVALRAGTLDDTSWLRPAAHFWTRRAQAWVVLGDGDERFDTQPADASAWLRTAGNRQHRSDH